MKMSKRLLAVPALASALALSGCFSAPVTFVTSSVPVEQDKYTVLADEVNGTHTQVGWLFFTFGLGGSGQRHALRDALRQVPGADALVGMAVDTESFMLLPFILPTFDKTRVTGTPVKLGARD